jgi:hypothetical protein
MGLQASQVHPSQQNSFIYFLNLKTENKPMNF